MKTILQHAKWLLVTIKSVFNRVPTSVQAEAVRSDAVETSPCGVSWQTGKQVSHASGRRDRVTSLRHAAETASGRRVDDTSLRGAAETVTGKRVDDTSLRGGQPLSTMNNNCFKLSKFLRLLRVDDHNIIILADELIVENVSKRSDNMLYCTHDATFGFATNARRRSYLHCVPNDHKCAPLLSKGSASVAHPKRNGQGVRSVFSLSSLGRLSFISRSFVVHFPFKCEQNI